MEINRINTWEEFKVLITLFNLSIQFVENIDHYLLIARKNDIIFQFTIIKNTPRKSDQVDFEDNFKANGNKHDTLFGIVNIQDRALVITEKDTVGSKVHDYNEDPGVAKDSISNHDFVVADGEVFQLHQILMDQENISTCELFLGNGGSPEVFTKKFKLLEEGSVPLSIPLEVIGTINGTTIRLSRTNNSNQSQDMASTFIGVIKT